MKVLSPEEVKDTRKRRTEEAKDKLWEAAEEETKVLQRLNSLKDIQREIENAGGATEYLAQIMDALQALNERKQALEKREAKVTQAENEIKRSAEILAQRWLDYHKAIHGKNARNKTDNIQ